MSNTNIYVKYNTNRFIKNRYSALLGIRKDSILTSDDAKIIKNCLRWTQISGVLNNQLEYVLCEIERMGTTHNMNLLIRFMHNKDPYFNKYREFDNSGKNYCLLLNHSEFESYLDYQLIEIDCKIPHNPYYWTRTIKLKDNISTYYA